MNSGTKSRSRARPASDLEHLVMRRMGQAIGDYGLVRPGDRILVAVSGDARSFVLLRILDLHRRRFAFDFELVPLHLGGGEGGQRVTAAFADQGFEVEVASPGDGDAPDDRRISIETILRAQAQDRGCNKIAYAQVLDDFLVELLANLFFHGRLQSLGISLPQGSNVYGIRPLVNVEQQKVASLAVELGFEFQPAGQDAGYEQSKSARRLIDSMLANYPRVMRSMLAAMKHIRPTHLMDPRLG